MATALAVVLPGDVIPQHALPTGTGKKKTLTLGPGLRHIPPSTVTTTVAGTLVTDNRKNAALVEYNSGRVSPQTDTALCSESRPADMTSSTRPSPTTLSSPPSTAAPPRTSTAS